MEEVGCEVGSRNREEPSSSFRVPFSDSGLPPCWGILGCISLLFSQFLFPPLGAQAWAMRAYIPVPGWAALSEPVCS